MVNSFITFVVLATVLGMTGVNLSLPLLAGAGQTAAQIMVTGLNEFTVLCLSVVGVGLLLAVKEK